MTIPYRLANGVGNKPDADKWMSNYDYLEALGGNTYLLNGGFEEWNGGTSFSSPANGAEVADGWAVDKTGTSDPTFVLSREATIIDAGTYSIKYAISVAGSSDSILGVSQDVRNPTHFRGKTVVFAVRVRAATANKVRLKINDGVTITYSDYHSGDDTWELLTVTAAIGASITGINLSFQMAADFTGNVYGDNGFLMVVDSNTNAVTKAALFYSPLRDLLYRVCTLFGKQTIAGIKTFSGQLIGKGTTTNDDAAAGYIGEYMADQVSAFTDIPGATGAWGDMASITLTPGDWDISALAEFIDNGGTPAFLQMGVSSTSGNTAPTRPNLATMNPPAAGAAVTGAVPLVRAAITSNTTYYLKAASQFTGNKPQAVGFIRARRRR